MSLQFLWFLVHLVKVCLCSEKATCSCRLMTSTFSLVIICCLFCPNEGLHSFLFKQVTVTVFRVQNWVTKLKYITSVLFLTSSYTFMFLVYKYHILIFRISDSLLLLSDCFVCSIWLHSMFDLLLSLFGLLSLLVVFAQSKSYFCSVLYPLLHVIF